jgi:hypothetical protein
MFGNLRPGEYRLGATATGYLPVEYPRNARAMGSLLSVVGGENEVSPLLMDRGATVRGRLTDEMDVPVEGLDVFLLRIGSISGPS